jgi:hypothetical protein
MENGPHTWWTPIKGNGKIPPMESRTIPGRNKKNNNPQIQLSCGHNGSDS